MTDNQPVVLQEDESTGDRFLVYSTDKGLRLDIRYEGDALWMTQIDMQNVSMRFTARSEKKSASLKQIVRWPL